MNCDDLAHYALGSKKVCPVLRVRGNPTELRFNTRKYDGKVGLFEQQVLMAQELSRPINPSSANTSGLEGTRVMVGRFRG